MALPVLKCPYLSQLTLQQVRTSAPHILNAGVKSCPIFSQLIRTVSTVQVPNTSNASSMTRPMSFNEIKAVHEKVYEQNNQKHVSSKVKPAMTSFQPSISLTIPNPYGDGKKKTMTTIQFFDEILLF